MALRGSSKHRPGFHALVLAIGFIVGGALQQGARILFLVSGKDKAKTLREVVEGEERPGFGFTAAFSSDSRLLAVVYQDDTIGLWTVASRTLRSTFIGPKQGVRSVAFSPDDKTLATASDDSTLKLWNVATQQELLTIRQLGTTLTGLMFSPDGQWLVGGTGGSSRGGLRLYRAPLLAETDGTIAAANIKK